MSNEAGVEQLRAAIAEARERQRVPQAATGQRWTAIELARSLEAVEASRVVSSHWPLLWSSPATRLWSGINRVVRRYLRWYVDPIVAQQNRFNNACARALHALAAAQADLEGRAAAPTLFAAAVPLLPKDADERFEALMALVRARTAAEPPASFPDLELLPLLAEAQACAVVQAHWPLVGSTPYQQALIALHKLVRRYLRWLINPLVAQQNATNATVVRALHALALADREARARLP